MYNSKVRNDLKDQEGNKFETIEKELSDSLFDHFKNVKLTEDSIDQLKDVCFIYLEMNIFLSS